MFQWLIGFRKLTFAAVCIALATAFLLSGHIDGKTFGDVVKGIGVAFMGSNVGEHLLKLGKEYVKGQLKKDK